MNTSLTAFLAKAKTVAESSKPRLVFALDATASRQPTWETAKNLQRDMFKAVDRALSVQLVYFHGDQPITYSHWSTEPDELSDLMSSVHCSAGYTNIADTMTHALGEHAVKPVAAYCFVGDAVEGTDPDYCTSLASQLGTQKIPGFFFQEGESRFVSDHFNDWAKRSGGAYAHFNESSPQTLARLLQSVAAYASGGLALLTKKANEGNEQARLLLTQLKK
jgi:hypothetical protein